MKSLNGVAVIAAWSALAVASAQPDNLIVNGSFEHGGGGVCDVNFADQLSDWSFTTNCSIDWVRTETCGDAYCIEPAVPDGVCFIDLSGSCGTHGSIWQAVTLEEGRQYRLTFALGANCGADALTKTLGVSVGGSEHVIEVECSGLGCKEWIGTHVVDFVATAPSTEVRFTSVPPGNPNFGPLIDDVRLSLLFDCDNNGISDADEIAAGAADLNANGIPDTCECIADLTGNGEVNGADISIIRGFWGKVPEPLPSADINRDGLVDGLDLGVLLGSWGPCQ